MSRTAHKLLSASGGDTGYEIEQSLMFEVADSSYLSKTPSSASNQRTWTLSTWIKNTSENYGGGALWSSWNGSTQSDASYGWMGLYQDKLQLGGWATTWRDTNRVFRDVGAWYHIVIAVDTTIADGSADNRIRIYINGVEETSFATKNNPSQNYDLPWNSTQQHRLGGIVPAPSGTSYYFGGYFAETQVIDGSQLTPSSFGETDEDTGQWIPKKPSGLTYGTNGYYMKYVSGAIGTDSSGNGNNYTANNLANSDVMLDSPTNNFCTLNSLRNDITLTQGNLQAGGTYTSTTNKVYSTFGLISGKWWVQVHQSAANVYEANGVVNVSQSAENFAVNSSTNNVSVMNWGTTVLTNGSQTQTSLTGIGGNNVLGIALDLDNGTVQFYINGSTIGSATSLTRNTGDVFVFCQAAQTSGYSGTILEQWNFGQNGTHCGQKTAGGNTDGNGIGDFLNAPPSGFLAPCSANLATPAIKKSTEHFNTVIYTGTGSTRSVTGVGHQPDWLWIKSRSGSDDHRLQDAVRGSTKYLESNTHDAEVTDASGITAFGSDGFTIGADSASRFNVNTTNYVAWSWKANGSGSANTDGATNSVVSANTTSGFSIVTYSGTGSATTIGHGLGVVPAWIVVKNRTNNSGNTDAWANYHHANTAAPATDSLYWDTTYGTTDDAVVWNDTAPTSSVFTVNNWGGVNASGDTYVAYVFAEVEGFSKFSSYTGNGEAENGPYVYTGFTPRFVFQKKSSASGTSWFMWDSVRHPNNVIDLAVWANDTYGDASHAEYEIDFLSNGFKLRGNSAGSNASGATHLYMAFAESPFKYANAR